MCVCRTRRWRRQWRESVPLCTSLRFTSMLLWPTSSSHSLLNCAPLPVSLSFCFLITSPCFHFSVHCVCALLLKKSVTLFWRAEHWSATLLLRWGGEGGCFLITSTEWKPSSPEVGAILWKGVTSTGSSLCPTELQTPYSHLSSTAHFASAPCHSYSASHCL